MEFEETETPQKPAVSGRDLVDMMQVGVETAISNHLVENIVNKNTEEFRKNFQFELEEMLKDIVFANDSYYSSENFRPEYRLLIKWAKLQKDREEGCICKRLMI